MKITISSSENEKYFVLKPNDFKLSEIRDLEIYIKNINNGFVNNGEILIPINKENIDTNLIYSKIKKLFEDRFSCELITDDNSNKIIDLAETEARNFSNFANKALQIRNNNISSNELESFINSLRKNNFKRHLETHQLLSAYHLAFSQNACNFSVPGSGKTSVVLAAYCYLMHCDDETKKVNKLVVVGPLSSFPSWEKEFTLCFGKPPKMFSIMGGISNKIVEDRLLKNNVKEDIIIVSYGSIESKKELIKHFIKNNKTMVVLDEAHRIKNVEEGKQSFAALSLSLNAKSRVILTGSPAPNSLVDIYNLYKFIWPSNNIIGYSVAQLSSMSKNQNDHRIPDLINRISPFFIRIKKSDLNLPKPLFHKPNIIKMNPIQRKIYDNISLNLESVKFNSHNNIFTKSLLIRLRQASTNPNLLNKPLDDYYDSLDGDYYKKINLDNSLNVSNEIINLIKKYKELEIPGKFIATKELLENIIKNRGKLLIWCEFIGTCQELSNYLSRCNINNKILYGASTMEERKNIIEEFHNEDSSFKVIIANPHAVGESISLQKACHNALYLEQSYNAGTYMQSKDRIHRLGLKNTDKINYYYFHSEGSIDNAIYDSVVRKEQVMLDLVETEEIPLISMNRDFLEDTESDIKAVIRNYYEYKEKNI